MLHNGLIWCSPFLHHVDLCIVYFALHYPSSIDNKHYSSYCIMVHYDCNVTLHPCDVIVMHYASLWYGITWGYPCPFWSMHTSPHSLCLLSTWLCSEWVSDLLTSCLAKSITPPHVNRLHILVNIWLIYSAAMLQLHFNFLCSHLLVLLRFCSNNNCCH